MRSEQKNKAKEKFYSDNTPARKLDNTKRTKGSKSSYKKKKMQEKEERAGIPESISIPAIITVRELAAMIQ
jgi:hypothetical protein